jgi:hypothetical protein
VFAGVFSWKKEGGKMDIGLRVEDRLDGAVNFIPWKERIVFLLAGV